MQRIQQKSGPNQEKLLEFSSSYSILYCDLHKSQKKTLLNRLFHNSLAISSVHVHWDLAKKNGQMKHFLKTTSTPQSWRTDLRICIIKIPNRK